MDAVFFHMPKTAGTAINTFFRANYPEESVWLGRKRGLTPLAAMFAFLKLPQAEQDGFRFVSGHMPLFILDHLPERFKAVTILRNPLERAYSTYLHTMRSVGDPLAERWIARNATLEEFVREQADWQMDNGQVRMLSGVEETVPYGECGPEHLAAARRNLEEKFFCHGVQERFIDTLYLFSRELELPEIYFEYANVSPNKPRGKGLGREQRSLLLMHNRLDMELYAFALERFAERFEAVRRADQDAYSVFLSRVEAMEKGRAG